MKLFSRILSRKISPEEQAGKIDLDMDVEPLRRRSEPIADDSGEVNATVASQDTSADDAVLADAAQPLDAHDEEPEEVEGAGWSESAWGEDKWDDDEDWEDDDEAEEAAEAHAQEEKAHLVNEIRDAVVSVSHIQTKGARETTEPRRRTEPPNWSNDEQFGRKAVARSQLGGKLDGAEDRILQETDTRLSDGETSRRRSAMAHLKAAAQATKADRVLKHVVGRDPTADPEEQSPYRDDLAKVVRPRSTSRPISRPVNRRRTEPAPWDQGTSDDDAAQFAAASEASLMPKDTAKFEAEEEAARQERLASAPADLSADEFADDNFFGRGFDDKDDEFEDEPSMDDEVEAPGHEIEPVTAENAEADAEDDAGDSAGNLWSDRFASDDDQDATDNASGDEIEETPRAEDAAHDDEEESDTEEAVIGDDADADEVDGPVASSVVSDVVAFANAPEESGSTDDDEVVRRKIWEMAGESAMVKETTNQDANDEAIVNVGPAVSGRAGRKAGRVKTRLLGFQAPDDGAPQDVFETAQVATKANQTNFPVAWIVVIDGPGRGASFTMFNGVTNIGRGEDQAVRLDFGDTSISRKNHAAVAFDDEQGKFFLGHGGKSNLVRLNENPVLSTEAIANGDLIRIGETTLKFIGLCNESFTWTDKSDEIEGTDAD